MRERDLLRLPEHVYAEARDDDGGDVHAARTGLYGVEDEGAHSCDHGCEPGYEAVYDAPYDWRHRHSNHTHQTKESDNQPTKRQRM